MSLFQQLGGLETARKAGVSEKYCERIAGSFVYPGFELDRVDPVDGN